MASSSKLLDPLYVGSVQGSEYAEKAQNVQVVLPRPPFIVFVYIVLAATANLLFGYENR
jgi:hypothetical protein